MGGKLKKQKTVKLNKSGAHEILKFVFGRVSLKPKELTDDDILFAQAMLVEMLDASFAIGFVEALFRSTAKIAGGPKKVIVAFLKGAGKNLVKYKDKDDLKEMTKDPQIYKMARDQLARNFKSAWKVREATGDLSY